MQAPRWITAEFAATSSHRACDFRPIDRSARNGKIAPQTLSGLPKEARNDQEQTDRADARRLDDAGPGNRRQSSLGSAIVRVTR